MLLLYALNTIHVAMSISLVWYYCIANYGHMEVFFTGEWDFSLKIIVSLSTFLRAFRLLSSFRWKYLVASLLTVFSVAGCTCGTVLGIRLFPLPSGLQDWFHTKVISDCSIAATLAWTLKLSSTSFQGSQRVLKRLLRASIQTGAIASIFAIITLVVYLCLPNTFLAKITAIPIGSIYCASVMDTLLSRQSLREMLQGTEPETYRDSHRERGRSDFGANTDSTGIRVELGTYDRKDKGKATGRLSSESHL
ncbi:hypothetical protein BKA70DRAFT_1345514 [Coprinopsis sp. MPI-PUGE-AT-0042]|nr:hypothetical protein BKA70DRAFT_1345514 [Coprinopsis sp. MPI-PUGE-AT-0042]